MGFIDDPQELCHTHSWRCWDPLWSPRQRFPLPPPSYYEEPTQILYENKLQVLPSSVSPHNNVPKILFPKLPLPTLHDPSMNATHKFSQGMRRNARDYFKRGFVSFLRRLKCCPQIIAHPSLCSLYMLLLQVHILFQSSSRGCGLFSFIVQVTWMPDAVLNLSFPWT